ncbi:GPI mannosyltransferase [Pseudozyma hubeiensis]|nr:GPI mannosyltransferase [Pseudozyma hubeiensis]
MKPRLPRSSYAIDPIIGYFLLFLSRFYTASAISKIDGQCESLSGHRIAIAALPNLSILPRLLNLANLLSSPSLNLRLLRRLSTIARFIWASFFPIQLCKLARGRRLRLRPLAIIFLTAAHQSRVNRIHPMTLVIDSA